MRVLVTGGAGFIGSHTVDLLLARGYSVRIMDSLEPPIHAGRQKPAYIPIDAEFLLGDVRNKADWKKALKGMEAVIHLAAHQGYLTDFSTFAHVNDTGTALLYETIVNRKMPVRKVVVASSQAVYGEGKYACPQHGVKYPPLRMLEQLQKGDWDVKCPVCAGEMTPLLTEEAKVNPHNQYSVSKNAQELYSLILGKRYNIPTVAMRYSIVHGERQSFHNAYSGILRIFSLRLLNGLAPVVYEDGHQLRDYVAVADVARANLVALHNSDADFLPLNVGGSDRTTVLEYAAMLTKLVGKTIEPEIHGAFRFGDTRHVMSDVSRLGSLDWKPEVSLEQAAVEYLEWVQTQVNMSDHYGEAEQIMKQQGVIQMAEG